MSLVGKLLKNRYEIKQEIGVGGMATVYKARCRMLNRDVAIKVLKDEFTTDSEFIKKFNTEAQSAAALSHPNIVSVYDVGEEDGLYFIVMELIKGKTLKDIVKNRGNLSWKQTVEIGIQVAEALGEAHKNNIVHRDIKPHNIMITETGVAKVTDFGIAKAVTNATITALGNTMGSVHYFSPEHAKGGITDGQSDIYSLGIVMYEMITGRVPFEADTPVSVALKQVQEEPIPPIEIASDMPEGLNYIILKCIEKDKKLRYGSTEELIIDLGILFKEPNIDFNTVESAVRKRLTSMIPTIEEEKEDKKEKSVFEKHPFLKPLILILIFIIIGITIFFGSKAIADKRAEADPFIPNLAGALGEDRLTKEEAIKILEELGFEYQIEEEHHDDIEEGYVIKQNPKYQERYRKKKGSEIIITVSLGPEKVELPIDLVGKTKEEVEKILKEKEIKYEIIEEHSEEIEKDIIIKVEPEVKEDDNQITKNTVVKVTVSLGTSKKDVTMPNLVDKNKDEARRELEALNLKVEEQQDYIDYKSPNIITSTMPSSGTTLKEGDTVIIFVNNVPELKKGKLTIDLSDYKPKSDDKDDNDDKNDNTIELDVMLDGINIASAKIDTSKTTKYEVELSSLGRSRLEIYIESDGSRVNKYNEYIDLNAKTDWLIEIKK